MKIGNLEEAGIWFSVLKAASSRYHDDAVYNLAYIDYVNRRYDHALNGFREVETNEAYRVLAPYYIADIYLIKEITVRQRTWLIPGLLRMKVRNMLRKCIGSPVRQLMG